MMGYAFWPQGWRARAGLVAAACAVGVIAAAPSASAKPKIYYPPPRNVYVNAGGTVTWSPANGAIGYRILEDGWSWYQATGTLTQWQGEGNNVEAHTFQVAAVYKSPAQGDVVGSNSLPVSEPPVNVTLQNPSGPNHEVCWDAVQDHDSPGNDAYLVFVFVQGQGDFQGQVSGGQTCYDFSQVVPAALKGFSVAVNVISASDINGIYQKESDPSAVAYTIYG